jgi:DNA topoisomerase IA
MLYIYIYIYTYIHTYIYIYKVSCASTRGDIWNHSEASAAAARARSSGTAQVLQVAVSRDVHARPLPLNTTAMLRAASDTLGTRKISKKKVLDSTSTLTLITVYTLGH